MWQDYVTAFNPWTYGEADETLVATRLLDDDGAVLGTICNYGCHPTSMVSPCLADADLHREHQNCVVVSRKCKRDLHRAIRAR
jgi:hypothetical protein